MSDEQPPEPAGGPEPLGRNFLGTLLAVLGLLTAAGAVGTLVFARWAERKRLANAVGSLRAYAVAQTIYHRNDWDGNCILEYATPYSLLATTLDGTGAPIMLIDQALVRAAGENGQPRYGYRFREMQTIGGTEINWVTDYALCATPAAYGRTGRYTFVVNTSGTVFYKDLGRSEFVKDFPVADPTAAGWKIAE